MKRRPPVSAGIIQESILPVRGQKVIIDSTIAGPYGVPTKVLLQAVRRNRRRFPPISCSR